MSALWNAAFLAAYQSISTKHKPGVEKCSKRVEILPTRSLTTFQASNPLQVHAAHRRAMVG